LLCGELVFDFLVEAVAKAVSTPVGMVESSVRPSFILVNSAVLDARKAAGLKSP
jgi:hypothetical protein